MYFHFASELHLITTPLRNCLLLAGNLPKNELIRELPSVTVLVYLNDASQVL
jgi:hypothetical protein